MEYKEIELLKQSAKSAVHLVRGAGICPADIGRTYACRS